MIDRRTGVLPVWVQCAVGCASFLTLAVAIYGPHALLDVADLSDYDVGWFRNGIAGVLALWIALALIPRGRLSGWLQLAVLLPLAHLAGMGIAWIEWWIYSHHLPASIVDNPILTALPLPATVLGLAATCALGGRVIAWRRGRDWVQVAAMIALLQLLLLGLWLPIITYIWAGRQAWWTEPLLAAPRPLIAAAVAPPLAIALALAAVAQRDRSFLVRRGGALGLGASAVLLIALVLRLDASYCAAWLYADFAHVLLAAAFVAVSALAGLAWSLAWRSWRSGGALANDARLLAGELRSEHAEGVGYVAITSWLRGPELGMAPCSVATPAGELLVPGGAELLAHLPLETTMLHTGEHVSVVRAGDRVIVGGYVPAPEGHPFRDAMGLVAGRVRVARLRDDGNTATDLVLALWRPCVAYLLILAAVALAAVAA